MKNINKNLSRYSTKKVWLSIAALLLIIVVLFLVTSRGSSSPADEVAEETETAAKIASDNFVTLSELSLAEEPITLYGKTASMSQVDVYAEVPAKITRIYARLGDYVNAGDVIITLDSSNEQSSLSQAELNLASAELGLEKTLAGSRTEDRNIAEADLSIKTDALEKTESDIEKQVSDLVIFLDETLRNDIDDYFDHTKKDGIIYRPTFTYRLRSESDTEELEEIRTQIEADFETYQENIDDYSVNEKMETSIAITESFSQLAGLIYGYSKDFLGFSDAENEAFEDSTLAVKNGIDGQKDILTTLQNLYDTQQSALVIAQNTLDKATTGATDEDISLSEANVDIAQNSVASARIALSKKTLRAPISGQITEMSADIGKLASSAGSIFSISNPLNIKVESSISTKHREHIELGKEVTISGMAGTITAISPVANATTGSISFEAVFADEATGIVAGDTVEIHIEKKVTEQAATLSLPLSAVFEEFGEYFIYILSPALTAEKHAVEFVKISGENILVNNTFSGEEKIIINARGIGENDKL